MKVTIVVELELKSDDLSRELIDTWAWALERSLEETLDLVEKATVVDFTKEEVL
jgi:hypothetical protein